MIAETASSNRTYHVCAKHEWVTIYDENGIDTGFRMCAHDCDVIRHEDLGEGLGRD